MEKGAECKVFQGLIDHVVKLDFLGSILDCRHY